MGPVMVITVGVLFLIDRMARAANGTYEVVHGMARVPLHFHQTWPVLVIVVGVMMLLRHQASTAGHVRWISEVGRG